MWVEKFKFPNWKDILFPGWKLQNFSSFKNEHFFLPSFPKVTLTMQWEEDTSNFSKLESLFSRLERHFLSVLETSELFQLQK
jgi:hypothetical protein